MIPAQPGGDSPLSQHGPPDATHPPQADSQSPARPARLPGAAAAASVVWALLPLLTYGLATPLVFGYAAYRRWTGRLWAATATYVVAVGGLLGYSATQPGATPSADTVNYVVGGGLLVVMLAGTVHAFAVRRRVFAPRNQSVPNA